ncbi:hypothetical protein H3H37_10355 [Duganella sp. LX20W]|uniref:DUF6916 domain-containing protein n=1 Tax=Rugamonas brunnea TaxID=2758569 RepID=A0A7W2IBS7_9BURK|nr:hypothetical protein [Rugamonas brunnea]MBA5637455.1 hypothetical protein [Rugamonas brunnea]
MERRTFILATGGLLGASGAGHAAPLAALATPGLTPAAALRAATFTRLVNQSFNVYASQRGVAMQLVAVKQQPSAAGHEQFRLSFNGAGATLPSGTYTVEHAAIGQVPMYLEVTGSDAQGTSYRADFNLLV